MELSNFIMEEENQQEDKPSAVVCEQCKQAPKFEHGCADNAVWWALECKCGKTTPLYRSSLVTISVWENTTHNQSKPEAREKFLSESPSFFVG